MYLVSILKRSFLLVTAAAALTCVGSAQSYDQYGQPRAVSGTAAAPAHATYRVTATARRPRHRRTVIVRRRPFSHSVAIVGGSALAGAGVGALVGGPPGAIVGALTGGVGGLIYDRRTHKRVIVVRE
jgi:hypothetical protein